MLNRGRDRAPDPGRRRLCARTGRNPDEVRAALGDTEWDAVLDTWSGAPSVVRESARMLAGRTRHYGYVSSRSVYEWPIRPGLDESAPVVDGDPSDDDALDYAAAKRGSELAVLETFSSTLIARAGLILGPYEDVGRLPWWLRRIEARRTRARARAARAAAAVHRRARPGDLDAGRRPTPAQRHVQRRRPAWQHHDGTPARRGPYGDARPTPSSSGCRRSRRVCRHRALDRDADLGAADGRVRGAAQREREGRPARRD